MYLSLFNIIGAAYICPQTDIASDLTDVKYTSGIVWVFICLWLYMWMDLTVFTFLIVKTDLIFPYLHGYAGEEVDFIVL